jgi:drug/metabolite transporter (DMT)-like permease
VAQVVMKAGVGAAAVAPAAGIATTYLALLTSPRVLLGLVCYGVSALGWRRVLAMLDVSQAYPFVALGFVLTMALGFLWLGETPHPTRLLGAAFILAGVWLVGLR